MRCCLVDSYFNLLVGNMARKWCLKLIVRLAAGAVLELLLEIKGVKGAQNQLFNSEGKAGEHYPQFPMESILVSVLKIWGQFCVHTRG